MRARLRVLGRKTVFKGKVVRVTVDRIIEPGGIKATREVVHHPGSVAILAHLDDDRVLLVRQFRYPTRQSLWELVAGTLEAGEAPLGAARRELVEETGYRARTFKPIFEFYPSPGILTERMVLVEARGLTPAKAHPDADELIEVGRFTEAQLRRMVRAKKIRDAKSLVGLLWLFSYRDAML